MKVTTTISPLSDLKVRGMKMKGLRLKWIWVVGGKKKGHGETLSEREAVVILEGVIRTEESCGKEKGGDIPITSLGITKIIWTSCHHRMLSDCLFHLCSPTYQISIIGLNSLDLIQNQYLLLFLFYFFGLFFFLFFGPWFF